MATNVLIAYTTNSGSTQQVAEAVAAELGKTGASVEVRRLEEVEDLSPYGAVVVGGPMILGWHRDAAGAGLRNVWLQQGAESPELLALGQELGLNLVSGKCIPMYAQPVRSFHWWHRAVVKLTGQL